MFACAKAHHERLNFPRISVECFPWPISYIRFSVNFRGKVGVCIYKYTHPTVEIYGNSDITRVRTRYFP